MLPSLQLILQQSLAMPLQQYEPPSLQVLLKVSFLRLSLGAAFFGVDFLGSAFFGAAFFFGVGFLAMRMRGKNGQKHPNGATNCFCLGAHRAQNKNSPSALKTQSEPLGTGLFYREMGGGQMDFTEKIHNLRFTIQNCHYAFFIINFEFRTILLQ